jgi:hypothetical protein
MMMTSCSYGIAAVVCPLYVRLQPYAWSRSAFAISIFSTLRIIIDLEESIHHQHHPSPLSRRQNIHSSISIQQNLFTAQLILAAARHSRQEFQDEDCFLWQHTLLCFLDNGFLWCHHVVGYCP